MVHASQSSSPHPLVSKVWTQPSRLPAIWILIGGAVAFHNKYHGVCLRLNLVRPYTLGTTNELVEGSVHAAADVHVPRDPLLQYLG